jgi:hypothetical protein
MKIKHPTEDNYVLNYEPPYAQQNLLFVQGRAHNTKVIELPEEWLELVDLNTISVHLTPIGANQNLIVKRTERNLVHLQGNGMPIDCYYLVIGERIDVPKIPIVSPLDK